MKQGNRITRARVVTLSLVFVAVIISLAFDSGLGTPSSFGIGQFFLLCPLGGIEALIASKSIIPITLISLAVMVVFALLFGRAWCAWGCPAPVIRRFFRRDPKPEYNKDGTQKVSGTPLIPGKKSGKNRSECPDERSVAHEIEGEDGHRHKSQGANDSTSACSAVTEARGIVAKLRFIGRDTRTWVLIAVLVATLIAGLPLFCLVCPIGLTFGTVGSLWHLIVDKQVTMSVIVFPAALLVELVLYRKWCMNLCPVAGLLNIFGQFANLFRPRIDASTCLQREGKQCMVCSSVCSERINLHAEDTAIQLGTCTRCGECVKHCPTKSITIEAKPQ